MTFLIGALAFTFVIVFLYFFIVLCGLVGKTIAKKLDLARDESVGIGSYIALGMLPFMFLYIFIWGSWMLGEVIVK